jgi:hypothetical protein
LQIVVADATGQSASKTFQLTVVSPGCADLVLAAIDPQICHPGSSIAECVVLKSPAMWAIFKPQSGYTLIEAAMICGFKGFNWQQWVTNLANPSPFRANSAPDIPLVATPPFLDPPLGGYVSPLTGPAYPFF